jgi:hypothetical protein
VPEELTGCILLSKEKVKCIELKYYTSEIEEADYKNMSDPSSGIHNQGSLASNWIIAAYIGASLTTRIHAISIFANIFKP